ncbi:MAG: tRNA epoxyqueuosine(34) reductase QueG [Pirellulales bacterium]
MPTDLTTFKELLIQQARTLGFTGVRVAPAVPASGFDRLQAWLEAQMAGEMDYLARRLHAYRHPAGVLPAVRSLVMLTSRYAHTRPTTQLLTLQPQTSQPPRYQTEESSAGSGRVARYAWGTTDYHDVLHERLHQLADWVREHYPAARLRGVVDTAPLLEREYAQLAGLGWIGKHTLLLDRTEGSWFFLAALLTDLDLPIDEPLGVDHCGTCRACLEACPTDAFPAPYVLDARRCISYLTIEHRGPIDHELRPLIGDWVFGCDVCQEVCPWNRRTPETDEPAFQPQPSLAPLDLRQLFSWDDATFRHHLRRTPLWRARRRGLLRNAAIVLGNQRDVEAIEALITGLHDSEPLVRGAAAWALGQLNTSTARTALENRLTTETDPMVIDEIQQALAQMEPRSG